ncbi:MAG: lipopolysaccharide biosynthesis protein [Woeseiaceae bacterium]
MPGLIKSTAILAFARITNFSLLFLSPVLLVRFLDTHTFGQYREFMVYATLISMLAGFSVKSNLLYFIPKDPDRTRNYVNNTIWIVFGTSLIASIILFIFRDPLFSKTSFDFLVPLTGYVLLFTNLDILESYWIAKKQPNNVFLYSVARTIGRLGAVLGTAMYSPTVDALIRTLLIVETIRILAVVFIMVKLHFKPTFVDRSVIEQQLAFIVPLGLAGSLQYLNQYIGQIAISTQLGVVALAIYAIGAYQVPVLRIVRGSINDSIFPDMVRQASEDGPNNLSLWKRSNIAYTFLIVPTFALLFCYADVLIPLVFTDEYAGAVPIFRILVSVMVIQCFEFSSPLRAINRNKLLLFSNVILLAVNLLIIIIFFRFIESHAIYGPAFAVVLAYIVQLIFLGWSITRTYSISPGDLMKWRSLAVIFTSVAFSSVALLVGELTGLPDFVRLPVFTLIFSILYFLLIRRAQLEEVETLIHTLQRKWVRKSADRKRKLK